MEAVCERFLTHCGWFSLLVRCDASNGKFHWNNGSNIYVGGVQNSAPLDDPSHTNVVVDARRTV